MELAEQIVIQLMQPTFYYATVLMLIASACLTLLLMINKNIGPRMRSILLIGPLIGSLAVLLTLLPALAGPGPWDSLFLGNLGPGPGSLPGAPAMPVPAGIVPIAALVMALGGCLGVASLLLSTVISRVITRRLLQVVDMGPEDYLSLHADVRDLAETLDIPEPRLGLVEDLRPNAFTFGRGRHAMVVFSMGMLTLLDDAELKAVAAHELAHIKNRDVWFKAASRSLAWAFFYNPAAHLMVRAAQRERERLADQTARSVLDEQATLMQAIEKVSRIIALAPRPTLASRLGLRMTLSLGEHSSLLSDHPSLADRARDYRQMSIPSYLSPAASVVISVGVVFAAGVLMASVGEVRTEILHFIMDPIPVHLPSVVPLEHHFVGMQVSWSGPSLPPSDHVPTAGVDFERIYGKVVL